MHNTLANDLELIHRERGFIFMAYLCRIKVIKYVEDSRPRYDFELDLTKSLEVRKAPYHAKYVHIFGVCLGKHMPNLGM